LLKTALNAFLDIFLRSSYEKRKQGIEDTGNEVTHVRICRNSGNRNFNGVLQ
jgi:hypothetical protein